jgi:hypothetical protein
MTTSHDFAYTRDDTMESLLAKMAHLRPARELREDWSYVNLVRHLLHIFATRVDQFLQFYMLASEVVARYSGRSFPDFVAARIFAPIGMPASTYSLAASETVGTAVHWFTRAGRRIPPWITGADVINAGPGGVISNTQDLSSWLKFLLGHGDESETRAVPAVVVEQAMSPQALMRGYNKRLNISSTVTYGFGWRQQIHQGHRVSTRARREKLAYTVCAPVSDHTALGRCARSLDFAHSVPGRQARPCIALQQR